ncbi:MAG: PKD domain-containing protein, partial [Roseiflexaceae bacterium]|nr:PKD domain-containing protein [Roseiflexaceae bacterium]
LPVQLAGFNMLDNGGNNEPSLQEIFDTFGYRTNVLNPGEKQSLTPAKDSMGIFIPGNFAVGDEVISAKWTRADASQPVYVRQLAALSGGGSVTSVRIGGPGGGSIGHGIQQFQSFLPLSNSTEPPSAPTEMTVNPTSAFSVGVGGYSSDRPNEVPGVRFWAARDRSGALIPNTYLVGQDYVDTGQTNFDYQDNVYVITNIRPTRPGADVNKPAAQPGSPNLVLEFDKSSYPGTLTDKDGETIGFPETQRNKSDTTTPQNAPTSSYNANLLNLDTAGQGTLTIRTSTGSNTGTDNSLVNGLCSPFDGRSGKFVVSTRLIGPLTSFTKAFQQGGVMFGPNQGNFLKLTAGVQIDGNDPGKPWIQWTQEVSNTSTQIGELVSITSPQTVTTLDLQMTADAATGKVEAAYRINGGILVKLPTPVTLDGTTRARFFDLQTKGCVLALHKSASEISVVFDRFAITPAQPEVDLPLVNAGPDQKVPVNAQVTLNGTATDVSGTALTGSWEQVSGTPQVVLGGSGNSRTFTAPNTYKVLTFAFAASDGQGRSASDTVEIVVGDEPITRLTVNAASPVELGDATRISASMQGGAAPISYEWNFGDGTAPVNGGPVIKHIYTALGTYTVTLTARNAAGSATAQTVVTVQPAVPDFAFRYNVGGPTVTTASGEWKTDDGPPKLFTPNAPREKRPTAAAIENTNDDAIYQDYRGRVTAEPKAITFEIPINSQLGLPGTARVVTNVRLHFAELFWGAPGGGNGGGGSRTFNIDVEGTRVFDQFDIFLAAGGANRAVVVPIDGVAVTDGKLTISLQAVKDYVSLAAIEVLRAPKATPENNAPTANAGPDQVATVGTQVTLTGSGSDPDGDTLTYRWEQTGGPAATLGGSDAAAVRTFTPNNPGSYIFNLTTTDTGALSGSDTIVITVNDTTLPPNNPPTAEAGQNQTALAGILITLTGSGSDPDGDALTYRWQQTAGPSVSLGGNEGDALRTFTATSTGSYIFTFTTTDARGLSGADSIVITIVDAPPAENQAPTANAGLDQTVAAGGTAVLNGAGSSDAEGGALTYSWQQTAGPAVTLSSSSTAQPTFVTPSQPATLAFQLVVTDNFGVTSAVDEVQVRVIDTPVVAPGTFRLSLPLVTGENI